MNRFQEATVERTNTPNAIEDNTWISTISCECGNTLEYEHLEASQAEHSADTYAGLPCPSCQPDTLPVGTKVAYMDMANPYQTAIVVSEDMSSGGLRMQDCIFEDGHTSSVSKRCIEGIGGWRMAEGVATPAEVEDAKERGKAHRAELDRKREEYFAQSKKVEDAVMKAWPDKAKAAIVATLVQNECDSMTDYFATSTSRTVVLGWSKHTRNLFPEMRKHAKLSSIPEVAALGNLPYGIERYSSACFEQGLFAAHFITHFDGVL